MKINKLSIICGLLVLVSAFVVTGCGASENEEATSMTGKADPAATDAAKPEGGGKGGMTPPPIKEDGS